MKMSTRLTAIAELIAPCEAPDPSVGSCWHGHSPVEWPCATTRAAWLARNQDPITAEASARRAARNRHGTT